MPTKKINTLVAVVPPDGSDPNQLLTILAATGDMVTLSDQAVNTTVRDASVFDLISMARSDGHLTGAVFDPHPEINGLTTAVRRLKRKADAGAQFAVTQPVYDEKTADEICR